ncbi:MAG: YlbF family regulator [Haloferacaceae archaeon]
MSVETTHPEEIGRELGEQIAQIPEYEAFAAAKERVENDEPTQEKVQEFEQTREEFMVLRQTGNATQEDLQELQQLQEELHEMPLMAEYLEAQERLQERLTAINDAISDPLAVDFGGEAGGCCND